jgi:hypothetical protein
VHDELKQAAVELDAFGERTLGEISAAEFLDMLERVGPTPQPAIGIDRGQIRARDFLLGWIPEKKKVEIEVPPTGGKLRPPKLEKKKVELEKLPWELPKWSREGLVEEIGIDDISERLTAIEERLAELGR